MTLRGNCPLTDIGTGHPLKYRFLVGEYTWTGGTEDPANPPTVAPASLTPGDDAGHGHARRLRVLHRRQRPGAVGGRRRDRGRPRRRRLRAGRRPAGHRADVQPAGFDRGGQRERVELPAHVRPAGAQHGGDHGAAPAEEARWSARRRRRARRCRRPSRSRSAATGWASRCATPSRTPRRTPTSSTRSSSTTRRSSPRWTSRSCGSTAATRCPARPRSTCCTRWTTRT